MIRKMTKAYQLEPMTDTVRALQYKKKWYPVTEENLKDKHIFIKGWQKITDSMLKTITVVPNLTTEWTAQDIKEVADKFSMDVAYGLLKGWGESVFSDSSYGLAYAKHEILNMAYFGKLYDEFTDKIHELSQRFIKHLLSHSYRFEGAWMYYKDELIGQAGLYESIWLSPLQHIEHLLKGTVHLRPQLDPIGLDKMLCELIMVRLGGESLLKQYVSVKDRIKFLTTQKIADDFEQIFTWQEVFQPEVKDGSLWDDKDRNKKRIERTEK